MFGQNKMRSCHSSDTHTSSLIVFFCSFVLFVLKIVIFSLKLGGFLGVTTQKMEVITQVNGVTNNKKKDGTDINENLW